MAYTSRSLNDYERKYDTYERKALAIIYCVTYFRPYLYRRKVTSVTNHKPLVSDHLYAAADPEFRRAIKMPKYIR